MDSIQFENDTRLLMLYKMILIRTFETAVSNLKLQKKIYGMAHCYSGQEAVAVGVCSALNSDDYIISNHRPHGHALAKGIDSRLIMAEILGKVSGTNGGKGGSMHIHDREKGLITATGIVGSGIPVACGAAFSAKYKQDGKVACVFFGDGAANEGVLYETLNLASGWKLPLIFVLENNGLAVTTVTKETSACSDYPSLAKIFGIRAERVNGQDVNAVYKAATVAVHAARNGNGPSFIEAMTIRFQEHAEGEWYLRMRDTDYRDNALLEEEKLLQCPIKLYVDFLRHKDILTESLLLELYAKAELEVQNSLDFALSAPAPDAKAAFDNIYVRSIR